MKSLHDCSASGSGLFQAVPSLVVKLVAAQERERFDRLLADGHYLGVAPPVGDFLRQGVVREGQWVALLVWGPAALKLKDREGWIGWNAALAAGRREAHRAESPLPAPARQGPGAQSGQRGSGGGLPGAARAVGATVRRPAAAGGTERSEIAKGRSLCPQGSAGGRWQSFTDPESFSGTCYKAGGWEPVGRSAGASRHRADYFVPNDRPKRLWMRELCPQARRKICAVPLAPEHAGGCVEPAHGVLPLSQAQRRSRLEVLRHAPDPRGKNTRFRIGPVLSLVSMARLCGARQISELARFATRLHPRQRAELGLPIKKGTPRFYEVPTSSVFYEVLTRLDPEPFAALLSGWLGTQAGTLPGALAGALALDGKMIRDIIGMVSLVEVEDGSPVAMAIMDQQENTERCELKAAQQLLAALPALHGQTITADPLHCQQETARLILEKGGDYFLQIKGNQPTLLAYARTQTEGDSRPSALPR